MSPARARQAGVCLHITSLPGPYGIGELGRAARDWIDALAAARLSVWQFLPTGPTGFGDSPYQPLSTFAGNELLIDIGNLLKLELIDPADTAGLREMPTEHVDFGKLIPVKSGLLTRAAANFEARAGAALRAERDAFVAAHDESWLHDYALFRALKADHEQRPWTEWEAPLMRRDPPALARASREFAVQIEHSKTLQFLFARQWYALHQYARERNVTLFGDMPIYIALDSADAWAHPELLLTDSTGRPALVAGVPPDYFSADGQLWGNPLYDWHYHEQHGFAWWQQRLAHACRQADLVRIDHFRGFDAFWAIPADSPTARHGEWLIGPGDSLFTALRTTLGELPLVAEDLGIITASVEDLRDRQNLPGMRVLQFELTGESFSADALPANSVCYTGTHDNDTTAGWFRGSPSDLRSAGQIAADQLTILQRTHGNPDTIAADVIRTAFASPAWLALAPAQDYLGLGSEARLNTPGTTEGNWQWRLNAQLPGELIDTIAGWVAASARCNNSNPAARVNQAPDQPA